MRKLIVMSLCIAALGFGLSLASCQKKEMATEEPKQSEQKPAATGGYGEQKPAESGGYGEQKPAEEKPAAAGGYSEPKPAPSGGYGK
jgi:hypothetical protein